MSLVTLVYAAILPLLSKRYAAKWRYMVWLVIEAGWIFPFRPRIELSFLPVQMPDIPVTPVQPIINVISSISDAENVVNSSVTIPLWLVLAAIWIIGMVSVVVYHALRHGRFMKMVRRWSEPITDLESLGVLDSLKSELGIKTAVGLSVCQSITSPMLVGFFHPAILLPPVKITDDELSLILKHELIHFKRHDLWYKSLILAATAIHWFNPAVYLMAKAGAVQCEISCDVLVLDGADFEQRKQYGETIIGVARNGAKLRTVLSTDFYGGKRGMKNRISSIMDTRKKKAGFVILCVVLVAIIGTGVALAVTNKEPNTSNSEPEIFENVSNQLDTDVEFTNGWRSPLVDLDENGEGGKFIIVQVGSLKSDPEQGVAVVCHQNKDSEEYVIDKQFLTPSKHGAIKIESLGAKDFTMTVIAEDEYKWIFNIYNGFTPSGDQIADDLTQDEAILIVLKDHTGFPASTSDKITLKLPIGGPEGSTVNVTFATSVEEAGEKTYIVILTKDWGLTVNGTYVKSFWKYRVTSDGATLIDSVDNDALPGLIK
ncbi:MAG: M56 family metallopeptidase [Ruminiclostridium sp.]